MSLGFEIEAAAYLFSTFASLRTATCWIPSDASFVEVAANRLARNSLGEPRRVRDLPSDLRRAWGTDGGKEVAAIATLRVLSTKLVSITGAGIESKISPDQLAVVRLQIPLSLIHFVCLAETAATHNMVIDDQLLRSPSTRNPELVSLLGRGLADGHLHLGAAVPFPLLFLLAAEGIRGPVPEREQAPFAVCGETAFRPDVLLLASKWALYCLALFLSKPRRTGGFSGFISSQKLMPTAFRRGMAAATFWKAVSEEAQEMGGLSTSVLGDPGELQRTMEVEPLLTLLSRVFGVQDSAGATNRCFFELLRHHFLNPKDEPFAIHLTQVLRCLSVMQRWVTPSHIGGLDEFGRLFARHRRLRAGTLRLKENLVDYALEYLNRDGYLRKAELRFSVQSGSSRDLLTGSTVAQRCKALLGSFATHLQKCSESSKPEVVLPVSFVRRRDKELGRVMDERRTPCRWQFGHIWKAMIALSEMFNACPEAKRFFGVLDVAGNEHELCNWMFFHLVHELQMRQSPTITGRPPMRNAQNISFTFHVGETFENPVQGLRAISEVLEYMPRGVRLGHALALGAKGTEILDEVNSMNLLDDLTWSWMELSRSADPDLRLIHQVEALAKELGVSLECGRDLNTLWGAYRMRHDMGALRRMGLFSPDVRNGGLSDYDGAIATGFLASENLAERLLATYLSSSELDNHTTSTIGYRDVLTRTHSVLVQKLRKKIVQIGTIIEACPTSNLLVGRLGVYAKHPMFEFAIADNQSPRITINTDDPGLLHVDLPDEYETVWNVRSGHIATFDERMSWMEAIRARGFEVFSGPVSLVELQRQVQECSAALDSYMRVEGVCDHVENRRQTIEGLPAEMGGFVSRLTCKPDGKH